MKRIRKTIKLLLALSIISSFVFNNAYAGTVLVNGRSVVGAKNKMQLPDTDNAYERVLYSDHVEYYFFDYVKFAMYRKDDAYMNLDSGKYTKLFFQVSKSKEAPQKKYALDVYIDGKCAYTFDDFDKTPGQNFDYNIEFNPNTTIRLQLVSDRGAPSLNDIKDYIYVVNAKFS